MPHSFKGGIHPEDKKRQTSRKPVETMLPPTHLILPLTQHIGAICEPKVMIGDPVKMGQMIAESSSPVSSPIHAPVSGKVFSIEPFEHPNGTKVRSIILENDFEDSLHETVRPYGSIEGLSSEQIIQIIRNSGIVGMGGAGFPTHIKINSGLGKVDQLILNGAECEPYITSDHRTMLESPEQVVGGLLVLMRLFDLKKATIAVEANKEDVVKLLSASLKKFPGIVVKVLKTRYPQGAEKQLIRTCTGREVPPGGLPADVGCAVFNVETAASIYRAVATGMPVIRRIVTVSGSAIANPKNVETRLGTPIEALFSYVGGFVEQPYKIIMGGPMMGLAQHSLQVPVIKSTGAVLAFCKDEEYFVKDPVCIRCGRCIKACPMSLRPIFLHQFAERGMYEECQDQNVRDCIECGSCSYVCPARIPLVQSFRATKAKLIDINRT